MKTRDYLDPLRQKIKKSKLLIITCGLILIVGSIGSYYGLEFLSYRASKQASCASTPIILNTKTIHDLINKKRGNNNLEALESNPKLIIAASQKGSDMNFDQYFDHYHPTTNKRGVSYIKDVGYNYTIAGENLGVYFESESELVEAWMNSPTHKKNILDTRFTEMGIAAIPGSYQGYPTSFVVQMFANPSSNGGTGDTQKAIKVNPIVNNDPNKVSLAGNNNSDTKSGPTTEDNISEPIQKSNDNLEPNKPNVEKQETTPTATKKDTTEKDAEPTEITILDPNINSEIPQDQEKVIPNINAIEDDFTEPLLLLPRYSQDSNDSLETNLKELNPKTEPSKTTSDNCKDLPKQIILSQPADIEL